VQAAECHTKPLCCNAHTECCLLLAQGGLSREGPTSCNLHLPLMLSAAFIACTYPICNCLVLQAVLQKGLTLLACRSTTTERSDWLLSATPLCVLLLMLLLVTGVL